VDNILHSLTENITDPPSRYSACYVWAWNAKITRDETERQIGEMLKAGIKAFCIIPEPKEFRPTSMKTYLEPEYLSEEYFDAVKYAVDVAARHRMTVWLYDEGGWPSGGACRRVNRSTPGLLRKRITVSEKTAEEGQVYRPPEDTEHSFYLAAFDEKTGMRIRDGHLFTEKTQIVEYFSSCISDDYLTDIADKRTTDQFIRLTHEGYARSLRGYFGNVVPLIFDDEPALEHLAWTPGLAEGFKTKFGYDILDYLPYITERVDGTKDNERKANRDYRMYLGELFRENFLVPIREWCRKNNIASAGHLNLDDTTWGFVYRMSYGSPLSSLRRFDIPGIDVIWRQIWRGKGHFFARFASSAASQIGKNEALAEMLAVYGDGLTLSDMRRLANLLAVRGINLFNLFGMSYGKKGCLCLIERPVFDPSKPGFYMLKRLNDTLARISYIMHMGKPDIDTALYLPVEDILRGGEEARRAAEAFDEKGRMLEAQQIDFDIVDDEFIANAEIKDGLLCGGNAAYSRIEIPECSHIPTETAEKLKKLKMTPLKPVIKCRSSDILARKRRLPSGDSIVYIVNAGESAFFDRAEVYDTGECFVIDAENGTIKPIQTVQDGEGTFVTLNIPAGEECILLFTADSEFMAAVPQEIPEFVVRTYTLDRFEAAVVKECTITEDGIAVEEKNSEGRQIRLGSWHELVGPAFSGEVIYRTKILLDDMPSPDSRYILDPGKIEYAAEIYADREFCGICGFDNDTVEIFPRGREIEIEIKTANTFANQCVSVDLFALWDAASVGPYHLRSIEFEKESKGGGLFGPVRLIEKKRRPV
jgi:hypothetical protein